MEHTKTEATLSDDCFTIEELDRIYGTSHAGDFSGISNEDCRTVFQMAKRHVLKLLKNKTCRKLKRRKQNA